MEQKLNHRVVDLDRMTPEAITSFRHICEADITEGIRGVNACNIALNRRIGHLALPEFGQPMHSVTPEEDDPFLEKVHPHQLEFPTDAA